MKPIRFVLMLALSALTAGVLAEEEFTKIYMGPNIGIVTHPRKVFENLDLSKYELCSAANGTYYSDYTIINGAGRTIYLPLSQARSTVDGKLRLTAKVQSYYKYQPSTPYQTLQMNIVLEQRDDGIYAWCDKMYESTSTAESEHQPYAWMYFRDLGTDFGTVGNGNRVVMGDIGYDWRDIDGTFHKGFGIDNLILGRIDAAEVKITDLSGNIAVTDNCVIEDPGAVKIAGTFTGGGDLTYRATESHLMPGEVIPGGEVTACESSCITKTWVKVAENRKLSSMTNVVVDTFGTRTGKVTGGYGHWKNDGDSASVQVYGVVGSSYQAGSVLQFRQSGADIEASIYEAYTYDNPWNRGYNKDTYQYGDIDFIEENRKDPTQATGCATISIASGDVATDSPNGRAGLKNLRMYFADEILPYVSVGAGVYMKNTWQTVARNRLLSTLTNVTAITCGSRTLVAVPAAYCHWRNNGSFAAVQVYKEKNANYQTGSVLYFRQCGPDVQAAILPYSYNKPWQNGYDEDTYKYGDIDFEVCAKTITDTAIFQSLSVAKTDTEGQSGLKDLKLYFSDEQPQYVETTGLNNMTTGAVVRVGGTGSAKMWLNLKHTVNAQGLPTDGTLDVGANGIVTISHSTKATRMFVHDGGIVYQATNNIFALSMPVNVSLDNGTIALGGSPMDGSIKESGTFAFTALHLVRFANGADITGHIPRIGYGVDIYPYWHVTGSSPSSCSAGFRLFESPSFVLDVEDVTDSPTDDFTVGGVIDRNVENNVIATTPVIKIGAGTVSVTAELGNQRPAGMDYGLVVSNGVWRFASDKASNASLDVLLKGGKLAVASDVDAVLGKVALGVASEIDLEDGASISIAAPTDANWPEKRLSFTVAGGFALNRATKIRIGTSACLTGAQLRKIRINGLRVLQDEDGYLAGTKFGVLLLVR